jgi:hypothetical protein
MKFNRVRSSIVAGFVVLLSISTTNLENSKFDENNILKYNNIIHINKYNNLSNIDNIIINRQKSGNKSPEYYIIVPSASRFLIRTPLPSKKIKISAKEYDKEIIMGRIAAGIRSTETGGKGAYTRKSYSSDACGAYQYMPSTWNNYMGYKTACKAPAWVQDRRMISELKFNYKRFKGDWEKVIAAHFMPARANNKSTWNKKNPGNPTVRHYVNSVMKRARILN